MQTDSPHSLVLVTAQEAAQGATVPTAAQKKALDTALAIARDLAHADSRSRSKIKKIKTRKKSKRSEP